MTGFSLVLGSPIGKDATEQQFPEVSMRSYPLLIACICAMTSLPVLAEDCNENLRDDILDISTASSLDCNSNGRPDECDVTAFEFEAAPGSLIGGQTRELLVADLDGDEIQDIVTLRSSEVTILRSDGNGRFAKWVVLEVPVRDGIVGATMDFDLDGDIDLLVGGQGVPILTLLRNNSAGMFELQPAMTVAATVSGMSSDDLDGDARSDLMVSDSDGFVSVFLNRSETGWTSPEVLPAGSSPASPLAVDLDADLNPEIVVPSKSANSIAVLWNAGNGTFLGPAFLAAGSSQYDALGGDLDGDGDIDILIGTSQGVKVLENNGTREFLEPRNILPGSTCYLLDGHDWDSDGDIDLFLMMWDLSSRPKLLSAQYRSGELEIIQDFGFRGLFVLMDANRDGLRDVAALTGFLDGNSYLAYFKNIGEMQFITKRALSVNGVGFYSATGDFDADGDVDIATTTGGESESSLIILPNEGGGAFGDPIRKPVHTLLPQPGPHVLGVADWSGDGAPDIMVAGGRILYFVNNGALLFSTPRTLQRDEETRMLRLIGSDLDGNGTIDLAARSQAGVLIYMNGGAGAFASPESHDIRSDLGILAVADLQGDSRPEVITLGRGIQVLQYTVAGTFTVLPPIQDPNAPQALCAADMDGDSLPDLVVGVGQSLPSFVLWNNGLQGTWVSSQLSTTEPLGAVSRVDLDEDGDLDVVGMSNISGAMMTFRNERGRRFTVGPQFEGTPLWGEMEAADLDGDARVDLLAADDEVHQLHLYLNRTSLAASQDCNANGTPDECDVTAGISRDENGNGRPDECEPVPFHRGDANQDMRLNIGDPVFVLNFLFGGDDTPGCLHAANANDDFVVDISDAVFILAYLFLGEAEPPPPGAPGFACGTDPEGKGAETLPGCEVYTGC